jgi:beta-galactosidase
VDARRRTWFDERGLSVAARADVAGAAPSAHVPFYAGAMHYWRVEPARWAACLRAIHSLGLTLVETCVPWRVHEPEHGERVWSDERDLARFIAAARDEGLGVVLRPGPQVNAELTGFGMPDWVLADPECQARTAHGTPAWLPAPPRAFPIPSYASAKFRDRVRAWYAAVAEVVRPFLGEPVVAIGVDHEAQVFFRTGAYDLDYHPDAVAWWHEQHPDLEPPRAWDPERASLCTAWVEFKDLYVARALGDFATMLDEVGLAGVARFHNLPPGHYQLYDLRRIQGQLGGPVGIDAYTPRSQFPELRWRAASLAANARPLPLALQVGVGFVPWLPPLDRTDDPTRERDHLLTLLAAGVRGFNLSMVVERDRYYGAAITRTGQVEAHARWIQPLVAALAEVEWTSLRRRAAIALVDSRTDLSHGLASCVLDPMTPVLTEALGLGPGGAVELGLDPAAITARRWQTAVCRALELAQVPFAIVHESASADELAQYRAVIAPTGARVSEPLWRTLCELVEGKRTIVVIGPDVPSDHRAPRGAGKLKAASLDDVAGLAEDLAALEGIVTQAWRIERPEHVHAAVFHATDAGARVVFVISDAPRRVTATLLADDTARSLRDPLTNERVQVEAGKALVAMQPRGVRMLIVE